MNNAKYEKELEDLREKLNKDVVKYIEHGSKEEYKDLLTKSRELDEAIVKHIKSLNK